MTYEEFLNELRKDKNIYFHPAKHTKHTKQYSWERLATWDKLDTIEQQWATGGLTGGSCWDEGEHQHYAVDGETPPTDFEMLDNIMMKYWSDIPYLLYRKHVLPIIKTDSWTEYEYYGNSTSYAIRYVDLKDLFALLSQHGKLPV